VLVMTTGRPASSAVAAAHTDPVSIRSAVVGEVVAEGFGPAEVVGGETVRIAMITSVSGEQLVQQAAQRVDVDPSVAGLGGPESLGGM
jgi:hypothetical protein